MKAKHFAYGLVFILIICTAMILIWRYSDENRYIRSYCEVAGGKFFLYCGYPENKTIGRDNPCCLFSENGEWQMCDAYELTRGECR